MLNLMELPIGLMACSHCPEPRPRPRPMNWTQNPMASAAVSACLGLCAMCIPSHNPIQPIFYQSRSRFANVMKRRILHCKEGLETGYCDVALKNARLFSECLTSEQRSTMTDSYTDKVSASDNISVHGSHIRIRIGKCEHIVCWIAHPCLRHGSFLSLFSHNITAEKAKNKLTDLMLLKYCSMGDNSSLPLTSHCCIAPCTVL